MKHLHPIPPISDIQMRTGKMIRISHGLTCFVEMKRDYLIFKEKTVYEPMNK